MAAISKLVLVNGSFGDPVLYLDFPGADNAVLFDAGELGPLPMSDLADLSVVLVSHRHVDHFMGFDRVVRATLDRDKTVRVFGPTGLIDAVEKRLSAIEHMSFPFMQVVYEVTELEGTGDRRRRASFACQEGFARRDLPPARARKGGLLVDLPECRIRYAPADHTVACVAYAVDVKRGWRFDRAKAAASGFQAGRWVGRVAHEMSLPRGERARSIEVGGGVAADLDEVVRACFSKESGYRIAFVTDTRPGGPTRPGLVELARGARRFYCESYYPSDQAGRAEKHGHMTVADSAALAAEAGVERLCLMHLGGGARRIHETLLEEACSIFPPTHLSPEPMAEAPIDG